MRVIVNCLLCFAALGCGESKTEREARLADEAKERQREYIDLKVKELEIRFDKGETNAVLTSLTEMAESGCARAQGVLAAKLHSLRDFEKANYWAVKAADNGDGRGMNVLGMMHSHGQAGYQRSPAKAFEWYQKSSEAGCALGYLNLGVMYRDGVGCQKSPTRSFECFLKSAELGCVEGCAEVGRYYLTGRGVTMSPQEGVRWLKESVKYGSRNGRLMLAITYATGNAVMERDIGQAAELLADESVEVLAKSIRQKTLHEIGSYLHEKGDEKQERKYWTALLKSDPENPDLRWIGRLGILIMDFKRNESARRDILAELIKMADNATNGVEQAEVGGAVAAIYSTFGPFVDKKVATMWFERVAQTGNGKAVEKLNGFAKGYTLMSGQYPDVYQMSGGRVFQHGLEGTNGAMRPLHNVEGTDVGGADAFSKRESNLVGLCGVKFGETDAGGIPIAVGVDKGLVTRQFVPAKQFDEFDECFCLSTPKTHRVCKVYLIKSQLTGWEGSPEQLDESIRQKYLAIKPILERKYLSQCLSSYSWTIGKKEKKEVGIGFRFPNGTLDFSIADKKDREDLWGGLGWMRRALMIVATDKSLVELGKREAEELDREKVSDSADAL